MAQQPDSIFCLWPANKKCHQLKTSPVKPFGTSVLGGGRPWPAGRKGSCKQHRRDNTRALSGMHNHTAHWGMLGCLEKRHRAQKLVNSLVGMPFWPTYQQGCQKVKGDWPVLYPHSATQTISLLSPLDHSIVTDHVMLCRYDLLCGLQLPLGFDVGLSAPPGPYNWGNLVFRGIQKRMSDPYLSTKPASFTRDPTVLDPTVPLVLMWVPSVSFFSLPVMKGHLQMRLWLSLHTLLSLEINTPEQRTSTKLEGKTSL